MNDEENSVMAELQKSKAEFDAASMCLYEALQAFNERMERVETWIQDQGSPPQKS